MACAPGIPAIARSSLPRTSTTSTPGEATLSASRSASSRAEITGTGTPAAAGVPVPVISARELADLLADSVASPGVLVVDVRGRDERAIAGIPGAQAIHLDEFRSGSAVSQIPFEQPVVIRCMSGSGSEEASRILIEAGHPDVRNLAGGLLAWIRGVDPSQPSY